jgi:hypothetical protein
MKSRIIDNKFIGVISNDFIEANQGKVIEYPNLTLEDWDLIDEIPSHEQLNDLDFLYYNSETNNFYVDSVSKQLSLDNKIPLFEYFPNITLDDVKNSKVQLHQLGMTRLEPISDKGSKPELFYQYNDKLIWSIKEDIILNEEPKRIETTIKIYNNIGEVTESWISNTKFLKIDDVEKIKKERRKFALAYLKGASFQLYSFLYFYFKNDLEIWIELGGDSLINVLIDASENHVDMQVIGVLNSQAQHYQTGDLMFDEDNNPITILMAITNEIKGL